MQQSVDRFGRSSRWHFSSKSMVKVENQFSTLPMLATTVGFFQEHFLQSVKSNPIRYNLFWHQSLELPSARSRYRHLSEAIWQDNPLVRRWSYLYGGWLQLQQCCRSRSKSSLEYLWTGKVRPRSPIWQRSY